MTSQLWWRRFGVLDESDFLSQGIEAVAAM
jgi:hypothetical protein